MVDAELNPVERRIRERQAVEEPATEWQPDRREPASRALAKAEGVFTAELPATWETRTERSGGFVPDDAPPVGRVKQTPQPYHQRVRLGDVVRLGLSHLLPNVGELLPTGERSSTARPSINTSTEESND